MSRRGLYIVTEGTDGTGKSTVSDILADMRRSDGYEVIRVDEPDSAKDVNNEILVPIASELRRIIKDGSLARTALTNALLFTAQRRENWLQAIQPALEQGIDVVSARNYMSTLVYQGYGEGYDKDALIEMTRDFVGEAYMTPDFISILDLNDEAERARRIKNRGELETPDTFESMGADFQQRLQNGYRIIAEQQGIELMIANIPPAEIARTIYRQIKQR